jgi:hypothetical protein
MKDIKAMQILNFDEFHLHEAGKYEFSPGETSKRLSDRIQTNLRRYKDAQGRGDNYAIKRYEFLMRLDKLDEERLKIRVELHRLREKFKK